MAEIEHSDVQNRERISLVVLAISIASMLIISIVSINNAKDEDKGLAANKVMDATLPLYGTWVGTILAFYFSRNGAYQERSPLRVLLSAPHELYSESSVMGFCFVKSQSTRS